MPCKDCSDRESFERSFREEIPFVVIEKYREYEVRFFSKDTDPDLLKWHWDEENRFVEAIEENDWKFQYNNDLPIQLELNHIINIPEGEIHRIIKGTTDLKVKITKY